MNGLKVYFLQVTSSGTFASAMVSTKSELNQSPGGTPNLESPGESYEPLKSRERATEKRDPRETTILHRHFQWYSILYSLRSTSRDEQLSCSDQSHRRCLQKVTGRQRSERKTMKRTRGRIIGCHVVQ